MHTSASLALAAANHRADLEAQAVRHRLAFGARRRGLLARLAHTLRRSRPEAVITALPAAVERPAAKAA